MFKSVGQIDPVQILEKSSPPVQIVRYILFKPFYRKSLAQKKYSKDAWLGKLEKQADMS